MTDQISNEDRAAALRARMAASNPTNQAPTEPVQTGVSDDQPHIDLWEIELADNETFIQVQGFFSFNPLGVVIASNKEDGTHVVECIVPWEQVKTFQRITDDASEDEGDSGL